MSALMHMGDPCHFCETPHDDVGPGPCAVSMAAAYAHKAHLVAMRATEGDTWAKRRAVLDAGVAECDRLINLASNDISLEKVALAESILAIYGRYSKAGQDRASVLADAILQLSTGVPIRAFYSDLWRVQFATKNYDGWSGQRSDHEYGFGPRHGSICFSVGLKREVRARDPQTLSEAEVEAAVYYLHNLEKIQATGASS